MLQALERDCLKTSTSHKHWRVGKQVFHWSRCPRDLLPDCYPLPDFYLLPDFHLLPDFYPLPDFYLLPDFHSLPDFYPLPDFY